MTCLLLDKNGMCVVMKGKPDVFVEESAFDRILRETDFRNNLYQELVSQELVSGSSILIGALGKKDDIDNIYKDYNVTPITTVESSNKRGFGIYERL